MDDPEAFLLCKMDHTHLELGALDQLEDQAISIDQLVVNGESSPSSTQSHLPIEVERVELVILLVLQRDSLITLWQVLPAERGWEALQFHQSIKQEVTSRETDGPNWQQTITGMHQIGASTTLPARSLR